ncbi:MAG TPA: PEP-CTERM sorting domain-containing protein [Zeimonas sp.]
MRFEIRGWASAALIAASAGLAANAAAAEITWTNPGSGAWFDGTNWATGAPPTAADTALVNNGGVATAGIGQDVTLQGFGFGSTVGAGAAAEGHGIIAGNLTAQGGPRAVGALSQGDGSSAAGTLTVGGTLTGLAAVGRAVNDGPSTTAPSTATGSVVVGGDLHLNAPLVVGQALYGSGTQASGAVSVADGTLRTQGMANLGWGIGIGSGATGIGTVTASSVDTSSRALDFLVLGQAGEGGTGHGTLAIGGGDLDVANFVSIGAVTGQHRGEAAGSLTLGGTLRAQPGVGAALQVGLVTDFTFEGAGSGTAGGTLVAHGIENFSSVTIAAAALHKGVTDTASGSATIGSGGIVNTIAPGGRMWVGATDAFVINNALAGPGASVTGSASVAGDIGGYEQVAIGRVGEAGRANGRIDLSGGVLATREIEVGVVHRRPFIAVPDGVAHATGRLSVTDGEIAIDAPGRIVVGGSFSSGAAIDETSSSGTLELTRAKLRGGSLAVGYGPAAQGSLTADDSTIDVDAMLAGTDRGAASIALRDSGLRVRQAPMVIAAGDGSTGIVTASGSSISIDGSLAIAPGSVFDASRGSLSLADGTLTVGSSVEIGSFNPDSRGELSLENSIATAGGNLYVGKNANSGTLFGEAALLVDASLLTIAGDLRMDPGAAPGLEILFGVAGTERGLGGYGAIDADAARLAGRLWVDFAGLDPYTLGSSFDFDLIFAAGGFDRDFDTVGFANLAGAYVIRSYGITDVDDGQVWRVTLAAAEVPVPATMSLLLAGLLVALTRRRR